MLTIHQLTRRFGNGQGHERVILDRVSLNISPGERILLGGENGVGKTTFLKIIAGLDLNYEGSYKIESKEVKTMSYRQLAQLRNKKFGFVFQDYLLLEEESVFFNICLPLYYGDPIFQRKNRDYVEELISLFALESLKKKKIKFLSGGEKQKVAICRALVNKPEVLLLDEPTASLDPKIKQSFYQTFFSRIEPSVTVILVSHDRSSINPQLFQCIELVDGQLLRRR